MSNGVIIPRADREWLHQVAPAAERARVELWVDILSQFLAAPQKVPAAQHLAAVYATQIRISVPTIYTQLAAWRAHGWAGLLRKRWRARYLSECNAAGEFETFVERLWKPLCEQSQRVTSAAYRSLFSDHLLAGRVIPGYEADWRGIWLHDHRSTLSQAPLDCPYTADGRCTPRGWGRRNLYRFAPDRFERTAARIGMGAASTYLPKIPSSRVHLPFGRVVVMDDVYHDGKTRLLGNREPQIVVEMRALELKCAVTYAMGIKPVRERDDGTREHLRNDFTRYLMAEILVYRGFHPDGLLVLGELGTAHLSAEFVAKLERWAGKGKIEFDAGGIADIPLAKGLYGGRGRGNFHFKAALESAWSLYKNELALLPGQKGADPEHAPETLDARMRHDRQLMTVCHALCRERPDLIEQLRGEFPSYYRYLEAVALVNERIDSRRDHHLEGWDESGFVIPVWRVADGAPWQPESALDALPQEIANGIRAAMRRDPRRHSDLQPMTPAEAAAHCMRTCELVRLPEAAVPDILGRSLGNVLRVENDDTIYVPDRYITGKRYPVAAIVRTLDGRKKVLPRGSEWLVHVNPFNGRTAYISTADERYLGAAPVLVAGSRIDRDAMAANLAVLNAVKSREVKRLTPFAEQQLERMVADGEHNATLITGRNPVHDAQERAEYQAATTDRIENTAGSVDELLPAHAQPEEEDATAETAVAAPAASMNELFRRKPAGDDQ